MTEQITVNEIVDQIVVRDTETKQPVTITDQTLQVTDSGSTISVSEKSGDSLLVQDGNDSVAISEKQETITPQFKEVLTIIQQVPTEDEVPYTEEVDFVGDDLVYRGWTSPGTTTNLPLWRIRRTRFVAPDDDVIHDWADGNGNFDNIWDDRAAKSYS